MLGVVICIAFVVGMVAINLLPLPPWGKLLIGCLYGGAVGWGSMRWKNR